MKFDKNWFTVTQLTEELFAIAEFSHHEKVISYLIVVSEEALLIDTGMGYRSMLKLVRGITNNNIRVLLTHAHWDHIGSVHEFSDVWVFNNDYEKGLLSAGFSSENYKSPGLKNFNTFENDHQFQLDYLSINVIHTPGHTPGSVCFFVPEKGWLFTGDTLYRGPLYAHLPESNINDYKKSMQKLKFMKKKLS